MKKGVSKLNASKFMKSLDTDDIVICVLLVVLVVLVVYYLCQNYKSEGFKDNDRKLVFLYVDWCGYCKSAKPVIKQLEDSGIINVEQVNCDEDTEKAKKYGVEAYPTILLDYGNEKILRYEKGVSLEGLNEFINGN